MFHHLHFRSITVNGIPEIYWLGSDQNNDWVLAPMSHFNGGEHLLFCLAIDIFHKWSEPPSPMYCSCFQFIFVIFFFFFTNIFYQKHYLHYLPIFFTKNIILDHSPFLNHSCPLVTLNLSNLGVMPCIGPLCTLAADPQMKPKN